MAMQAERTDPRGSVNPRGVTSREMTDAEAAEVFGDAFAEDSGQALPTADPAESDAMPEWAPPLPPNLKVPHGVQLTWLRIRKEMTVAPQKGDRVLMCWPLNEVEERQAVTRARGDQYNTLAELAKATIRAVGDVPADRTGSPGHPGNVSVLWRELGPKGRQLVRTYYTRSHQVSEEEQQDFLLHCFATRTAEAG